ncbi:purine and uridine phosphorylase [Aspergillus indologenus CBS 114.80]|uniref:Purine and uridine phosphorylase n=1 Tax=Aspergillus indologenus CBS 114.80 TaxID=1450541 RepID=A0A2V5I4L8_9EURO|nr:purine and uridine phosphorylase [Aspergillus indologenus CBS 114.80]
MRIGPHVFAVLYCLHSLGSSCGESNGIDRPLVDDLIPVVTEWTDDNSYTLGSIHSHNVAVACLPIGIYGKVSASPVVAQMRATFQNIQLGLMVGIGGGVPSVDADIRLGGVVVSKPAGVYAGVIQYDYDKSVRDGRFQRTGSLNKPPLAFLTTVSQMQSDSMVGRQLVHGVIGDVLQANEDMRERYRCCRSDDSKLVTRPPRANNNPRIHYGLISSGDQVMKDATIRDAIAQDLGILCFEMEAAGLMDQLPSLVVRGISCAALAAAAYARVLLSFVPVGCQKKDEFMVKSSTRGTRTRGEQKAYWWLVSSLCC